MADIGRITSWLLKNKKKFNIEIESIRSTQKYIENLADIRVSAVIGGYEVVGRSVSDTAERALAISTCEFIERLLVHELNLYPGSGVAIHHDPEIAATNAAYELIERDAVLVHFIAGIPYSRIPSSQDFYPAEACLLREKLTEKQIYLEFYEARNCSENLHVVICRAKRNDRQIFGFGSSNALTLAMTKALRETIQNLHLLIEKHNSSKTTLSRFEILKDLNPIHHGFLGLDPDYTNYIEPLFSNKPHKYSEFSKNASIRVETYSEHKILQELNLQLVKAQSEDLQKYFLGKTEPNKINIGRFRAFDPMFSEQNLNRMPHFIG
jgi:hypothetical protein